MRANIAATRRRDLRRARDDPARSGARARHRGAGDRNRPRRSTPRETVISSRRSLADARVQRALEAGRAHEPGGARRIPRLRRTIPATAARRHRRPRRSARCPCRRSAVATVFTGSMVRTTRRSWCYRIPSARTTGCGTRRRRSSRSISACFATISRGHGASDVTPGDYQIEQLGQDVVALADALGIDRFAFCGLSLGGMIGLWLAAQAPARITHVVLANTSARADSAGMETRRQTVLAGGMASVADIVMGRFFSARSRALNPPAVAELAAHAACDRSGRIRRLLCRDPRHGSNRAARPDPPADADHRRAVRRLAAVAGTR